MAETRWTFAVDRANGGGFARGFCLEVPNGSLMSLNDGSYGASLVIGKGERGTPASTPWPEDCRLKFCLPKLYLAWKKERPGRLDRYYEAEYGALVKLDGLHGHSPRPLAYGTFETSYKLAGGFATVPAYAMENFSDSVPLDDLPRQVGCLGAREVASLGIELLDTLTLMWNCEVTHSDLSTGNVLLRSSGRDEAHIRDAIERPYFYIVDFGQAKVPAKPGTRFDDEWARNTTIYCAAPETIGGDLARRLGITKEPEFYALRNKREVDLWSLGALLFYLRTGSVPPEDYAQKCYGLKLWADLEDPGDANLRYAIDLCTRFDPHERSAREIKRALYKAAGKENADLWGEGVQKVPEETPPLPIPKRIDGSAVGSVKERTVSSRQPVKGEDDASVSNRHARQETTQQAQHRSRRRAWPWCLGLVAAIIAVGFILTVAMPYNPVTVKALSWVPLASVQKAVAESYGNGDNGLAKDASQSFSWLEKAANYGDAEAQNRVGNSYYNGYGVRTDYTQAVAWYQKAAEQGLAEAQNNLGFCYATGRGVGQDDAQAVAWYQKAAEQGNAAAQNNLGDCYYYGRGVGQDYAQAAAWYQKAADRGLATAQYNLGFCYATGRGVGQDDAQAVAWYKKAAEQGNASAQVSLGRCYLNGDGVDQSDDQAFQWAREAANQGDAGGEGLLGWLYYFGRGTDVDQAKAVDLFKEGVEGADALSQGMLAWCYYGGRGGLAVDYSQALSYAQLAADQGDARGEELLGWLYYYGYGVTKDVGQAKSWFQKAADQGDEQAAEALAQIG